MRHTSENPQSQEQPDESFAWLTASELNALEQQDEKPKRKRLPVGDDGELLEFDLIDPDELPLTMDEFSKNIVPLYFDENHPNHREINRLIHLCHEWLQANNHYLNERAKFRVSRYVGLIAVATLVGLPQLYNTLDKISVDILLVSTLIIMFGAVVWSIQQQIDMDMQQSLKDSRRELRSYDRDILNFTNYTRKHWGLQTSAKEMRRAGIKALKVIKKQEAEQARLDEARKAFEDSVAQAEDAINNKRG